MFLESTFSFLFKTFSRASTAPGIKVTLLSLTFREFYESLSSVGRLEKWQQYFQRLCLRQWPQVGIALVAGEPVLVPISEYLFANYYGFYFQPKHCKSLNIRLFLIWTHPKRLQTFLPIPQWRVLFSGKIPLTQTPGIWLFFHVARSVYIICPLRGLGTASSAYLA